MGEMRYEQAGQNLMRLLKQEDHMSRHLGDMVSSNHLQLAQSLG